MTEVKELLTVPQVARQMGRSIEQVRRYLRAGRLKGQRIGNQWFVDPSALRTLLQRTQPPTPATRRRAMRKARVVREQIFRRLGKHIDVVSAVKESRREV